MKIDIYVIIFKMINNIYNNYTNMKIYNLSQKWSMQKIYNIKFKFFFNTLNLYEEQK
jgi:hypothetical protein